MVNIGRMWYPDDEPPYEEGEPSFFSEYLENITLQTEPKYRAGTRLKINKIILLMSGIHINVGQIVTIESISRRMSIRGFNPEYFYTLKEYPNQEISYELIEDEEKFTKLPDKITNWRDRIK